MKRQTVFEVVLFTLLVAAGVSLRISLQDIPNFAPVAAMALFAGYCFRSWLVAIALPLAVMSLSDIVIGGHDWRMMAVVYGMLAAPVALRPWLRRSFRTDGRRISRTLGSLAALVACSLASSIGFFLVTNFASWLWFPLYDHTAAGLGQCYVQAIPFFRSTLAGDFFFAVVLFGGHATIMHWRTHWAGSVDAQSYEGV